MLKILKTIIIIMIILFIMALCPVMETTMDGCGKHHARMKETAGVRFCVAFESVNAWSSSIPFAFIK